MTWLFSLASRVLLGGGGGGLGNSLKEIAREAADTWVEYKNAETEVEKARLAARLEQLRTVADLQKGQATNWFSPMMIGQYLIVVPFGLWWAAVFIVSVINMSLTAPIIVQDVPPHLFAMGGWLVPAIIVGTWLDTKVRGR